MKVTGMKFNNKPVQSTNDMLQIAKRVNAKLRNAIIEIEKEIALAIAIEHKSVTVPTTAGKNKKTCLITKMITDYM